MKMCIACWLAEYASSVQPQTALGAPDAAVLFLHLELLISLSCCDSC